MNTPGTRFHPDRLREAMTRRGLTIRALAELAEVSPQTVQAAVHGQVLALRTIAAISQGLEKAPELAHRELLATG